MSTHNIGFYEDLTKIIFQLSSISSSGYISRCQTRSVLPSRCCLRQLSLRLIRAGILLFKALSRCWFRQLSLRLIRSWNHAFQGRAVKVNCAAFLICQME